VTEPLLDDLGALYLADVRSQIEALRTAAERALAQVDDAAYFAALDGETNCLALVVKHMAGNLRSRWTDFVISDGEKPDRHRDGEFVIESGDTRESLSARWDDGWRRFAETVAELTPDQLLTVVKIRDEPHTVVKAIQRALTHAAYHVGQIVFLARHFRGGEWQSLSIPRGQSERFNAAHRARFAEPGGAAGSVSGPGGGL
jgi:hypothetical protein